MLPLSDVAQFPLSPLYYDFLWTGVTAAGVLVL